MSFIEFIFKLLKGVFKGITFAIILAMIIGLPVYWLWNWVMPIVFHLPHITFWQAVGLSLLSTFLLHTGTGVSLPEKKKPEQPPVNRVTGEPLPKL